MPTPYLYEPGATRWRRHDGASDVRSYQPRKGWEVFATLVDRNPITGHLLRNRPQWWLRETYTGLDRRRRT